MRTKNLSPFCRRSPVLLVTFVACVIVFFFARDFFLSAASEDVKLKIDSFVKLTTENDVTTLKKTSTANSVKTVKRGPPVRYVEDILSWTPPKYLQNYKNPCWQSETGKLQCLPYFQLIGVDKSGSSDFFDRIQKHPEIVGNAGALGKETQWWSWKRYGMFLITAVKTETFQDYIKYFKHSIEIINKTVDGNGYHKVITGDGTPMDLWDFRGWPQIPQNKGEMEPKILTPHLIHHLNPKTKFIVIMRDPIDRLYSDFYFLDLAHPLNPENFHIVVNKSVTLLKMCQKTHSLQFCLYDKAMHHKWDRLSRIHLGFYSVYIEEWLKVFNRNQFIFFKTSEYSENTKETLSEVFEFLEVEKLADDMYERLNMTIAKRKHVTKPKSHRKPMLPQTRKILLDLYEPFNLQLANILGDKKYLFKEEEAEKSQIS